MKEAPNQKVQEKKPLLKFKNTKKNMCLERIWKKCFRHRPLFDMLLLSLLCKAHVLELESNPWTILEKRFLCEWIE